MLTLVAAAVFVVGLVWSALDRDLWRALYCLFFVFMFAWDRVEDVTTRDHGRRADRQLRIRLTDGSPYVFPQLARRHRSHPASPWPERFESRVVKDAWWFPRAAPLRS